MINRELTERQSLLKAALIPAPPEGIPVSGAITGRMVALLPGENMMSGVPGSKLTDKLEDIQEKFEESIRVGVSSSAPLIKSTSASVRECADHGPGCNAHELDIDSYSWRSAIDVWLEL